MRTRPQTFPFLSNHQIHVRLIFWKSNFSDLASPHTILNQRSFVALSLITNKTSNIFHYSSTRRLHQFVTRPKRSVGGWSVKPALLLSENRDGKITFLISKIRLFGHLRWNIGRRFQIKYQRKWLDSDFSPNKYGKI